MLGVYGSFSCLHFSVALEFFVVCYKIAPDMNMQNAFPLQENLSFEEKHLLLTFYFKKLFLQTSSYSLEVVAQRSGTC